MNPTLLKTIIKGQLIPISMWMFSGCIYPQRPSDMRTASIDLILEEHSPPASMVEPYVHKVRWPGETLSIISQWYTGSHRNWKTVATANPDINPKRILIGDDILIPLDLVKTNEPMPRNFLASLRKKKSPSSSGVKPAIEVSEIELYGPQEKEPPMVGIEEIELFGPQDKEPLKTESDEIELFER